MRPHVHILLRQQRLPGACDYAMLCFTPAAG
jgi:hypothetical protein